MSTDQLERDMIATARKLRIAERQVEGDYKAVFGDRAQQLESWIRSNQLGMSGDDEYRRVVVDEFAAMVQDIKL